MCALTCVYEGVFLHVGLLVEPLAAVLAGVRPRVRVDEQVCGQSGRALEHLSTHLAAKATLLDTHARRDTVHQTYVAFRESCVCVENDF